MRFTPAVVAAILAFTSTSMAAPSIPHKPKVQTAAAADSPAGVTLSKTQQVFLADLAQDRYNLLSDEDFVFDFNKAQDGPGDGGELIAANRKTMPALVGSGASMTLGRMNGCGINTFHVHPRSAELQLVLSGKLVTEMAPENGVNGADGKRRLIKTTLLPNQMTVFPMGSVHTQFNDNCEPASFIAAFASEDAGTGSIAEETFLFDNDLIRTVLLGGQVDGEYIDAIRGSIPKSIAEGVDSCLARCHKTKRSLPQ